MKKSSFLKIALLVYISLVQVKSIDIALTSTLTDTTNDNYQIKNNTLSIKANGEYSISGGCSECQINIAKGLTVKMTLNSISIDNSNTGPFVIKKNAIVELILKGESKIEDNEAIENEDIDDFEGAAIKFKSSSTLTISGDGKLKIIGNPKNGIKGASLSNLVINGGNLDITSAKNALACDNIITINDGTITINSKTDGIKAEPDSDDTESKGKIVINGGKITINSESDAIQAAYELIINGGNFNIKTLDGANTKNFDKDNDSAKGIKSSTNEHENVENILIINGGNFILDTADDSIHSDFNLTITGGIFEINSGDDGVHADQYLILGKEKTDNSLLNITIKKSYEGMEGAYIYLYSGSYYIISSDDGINTAGDTTQNCQPNQGGPQNNNGMQPHRNLRGRNLQQNIPLCGSFHMYIFGGDIYVNAGADGLDSNGNIEISGGNLEIWGAKSGSDGDPMDREGKLSIADATVLAGGNQGMTPVHQSLTINQQYIYTTQSYSSNKVISIKNGESIIRNINIPKNIGYIFYTSKDTNSNYKFSEGGTSSSGQTNNGQNSNDNNFPPNQNSDMPNNMPPNQNSDRPNNMPPNQNSDMPNNMPPNQNSDMPNNMPPNQNSDRPNNMPNQNSDMPNNMPPNQNSDMPNNMPPNQNSDMPNNMPPNQNSDMPNNMPPNQNSDMPNNMPPNQNSDMPNNMPPNQNSDMPNNMPPNQNDNPDNSDHFILFNLGVNMNINLIGLLILTLIYIHI